MKMRNMIAAVAAMALSAVAVAAMPASAADAVGNARFIGQIGAEQSWDAGDLAGNPGVDITGNGTYTVTWDVTGGTDTLQFLAVVISPVGEAENFTTDTFENLAVSVNSVSIDGAPVEGYAASASAINTAYYENGAGVTRIYLHDDWAGTGTADLPSATNITSSVAVTFTVSGLPEGDASTEAGTDATTGDTTAETTAPADTTAGGNNSTTTTTTTTSSGSTTAANNSGNTSTTAAATTTNTATGDNSGIAVAIAALAVAGGVALVSKKRK